MIYYAIVGPLYTSGSVYKGVTSPLTLQTFSSFGEGNGNPLQCSCLENPSDGVAQSQR